MQNSGGPGVPGELGVPDLVAPVAEITGVFDAAQEVCEAQPASIKQHGLVDDIRAGLHRLERFFPSLGEAFVGRKAVVKFQLQRA